MSKISTKAIRNALNGPTMGTRWSALFFTPQEYDVAPVQSALQTAVDEVDSQMSTWKPDSDLMRLNAVPVNQWVDVPAQLLYVLRLGLEIGHTSDGAFDIGMGDAVTAWGFGPENAEPEQIRAAITASRIPAHIALETGDGCIRKTAPLTLDLNGIAKGHGVDRLAQILTDFGITAGLVGIDGEMRAIGLRSDGAPWSIAVEAPDPARRAPRSILALTDAAVATSGDYRHWVEIQGRRFSHTMDPSSGAPILRSPASVTVVAQSCAEADAWATALMVLGPDRGAELARKRGLNALFLMRDDDQAIRSLKVGALFSTETSTIETATMTK